MVRLKNSLKKYKVEQKRIKKVVKVEKIKKKDERKIHHIWSDGIMTAVPFRRKMAPGELVLMVGDGDLSFTHSLVNDHAIGSQHLISSILEPDQNALEQRHAMANQHIKALEAAGVRIIYGLDATKLCDHKNNPLNTLLKLDADGNLDRVVKIWFNFPHTGEGIKDRAYNIKSQRRLLLRFLGQAVDLIRSQAGFFQKKVADQVLSRRTVMTSGIRHRILRNEENNEVMTPDLDDPYYVEFRKSEFEIFVTLWEGDPYDDWNIRELARSVRYLSLRDSFDFDSRRYPIYRHCRTLGLGQSAESPSTFEGRKARTYSFLVLPSETK